jgi:hypothetical protein
MKMVNEQVLIFMLSITLVPPFSFYLFYYLSSTILFLFI